jgi:hypothetical protein
LLTKVPRIVPDKKLSIKKSPNRYGWTSIITTRGSDWDGGITYDGDRVLAGRFTCIGYGNKKDSTRHDRQTNKSFKRFKHIADHQEKAVLTGTFPF